MPLRDIDNQTAELQATPSQWKTFFESLIWQDMNAILNNDLAIGVEMLSDETVVDLNKIQKFRGKLEYIRYMLNLPQTVSLLLEEQLEDREDEREDDSSEEYNDDSQG